MRIWSCVGVVSCVVALVLPRAALASHRRTDADCGDDPAHPTTIVDGNGTVGAKVPGVGVEVSGSGTEKWKVPDLGATNVVKMHHLWLQCRSAMSDEKYEAAIEKAALEASAAATRVDINRIWLVTETLDPRSRKSCGGEPVPYPPGTQIQEQWEVFEATNGDVYTGPNAGVVTSVIEQRAGTRAGDEVTLRGTAADGGTEYDVTVLTVKSGRMTGKRTFYVDGQACTIWNMDAR